HGPFHLGDGHAVRSTSAASKGSALFVILGIGRGAGSLASTEGPVQMELFILAPASHLLLTIM
ncbi:MAG: hypothetical protein WCA96_01220, partial [Methylocella sp.]